MQWKCLKRRGPVPETPNKAMQANEPRRHFAAYSQAGSRLMVG